MPWRQVEPVVDAGVREVCRKPYPNHPRGCPNHGKRATCPPQAPAISDVLDSYKPVWAIWNVFDLAAHIEKMRARHPAWSPLQLVCCLYWQRTARKALRAEIDMFVFERQAAGGGPLRIIACPEACGVNVTATMARIGERLEWPPKTITYQVALAGTARRLRDKLGG